MLPSLFVSHGAPLLAIERGPAHDYLRALGRELETPKAIVVASAQWESARPMLTSSPQPETIYDFSGFPAELYRIRYSAPGAVEVAQRAALLLRQAGFDCGLDDSRGLDHGAWVPLSLMVPQANIPVAQLSVQPHLGAEHHFAIGKALQALRGEGILLLGSGSLTHNLREVRWGSSEAAPAWVEQFDQWMASATEQARYDDLLHYRERAPHAQRNHPTEEHLLPFFVALGAATPGTPGKRVHHSHTFGVLAMDVYRFD
jgi:4,5-DOPA dioxygenase extradiol